MAPTALTIGEQQLTAAKPWAELPPNMLQKTVFFHHGTYTNSHPNHPKVMRLMGSTERNEMLVSVYSGALSDVLETVDGMRAEGVLRNDVIVGTLNVFGRDLARKGRGGRDHNGRHHWAVLIGEGLRGGVIGGIEPTGTDYQAQAIDSGTGLPSGSGDVPHEETFQSMAKTLGVALGVRRTRLDEAITGDQVIEMALAE